MARTSRTAPVFTADTLAVFTTYADAYGVQIESTVARDIARVDAMLEVDELLTVGKWTATNVAAGFLAAFGSHAAADFLPTQTNRVMPFALTGRVFAALTDEDSDDLVLGTYEDQYGRTAPVTVSRVAAVIEYLCNYGATKTAQKITGSTSTAREMIDALTAEYDALKSAKKSGKGKGGAGKVITLVDALATMTETLEAAVAQLGEIDSETADGAGLLSLALAEFAGKFGIDLV